MYASVLLCFGLCQYCAWSTWAADENAKPRVRAWTLMMLVPDAHHLAFAYGLYLRGPHGRYDAAFAAHYAIQGALPLARLALLASTAAGAIGGVRSGKDRGPTLRTLNQPGPRAGPTLTLTAGGAATFQLHRSKCGSQGLRARNLRVATTALLARSESRTTRQVLTDAFTAFFATDPTAASIAWPASWRVFPTTAAE